MNILAQRQQITASAGQKKVSPLGHIRIITIIITTITIIIIVITKKEKKCFV